VSRNIRPLSGGRLLSIGECMVEMKQADGGLWQKAFAGDTFNAAYYARLFLPAAFDVEYLSAVGTCPLSLEMLRFMQASGIGTRFVSQIEGGTPGLYMIHLENGERSFSYWRSASAARKLADDPDHLDRAIAASDVIIVSGITLAILHPDAADRLIAALARARADGRMVVFDPNIRPRLWDDASRMRDTLSRAAGVSNLVMPSFDDEATHFGDSSIDRTIERYRALGADAVLVKDGARGVTVAIESDEQVFVPAAPITEVVDSTSAGDSFNGAFLARFLETGDSTAAAAFAAKIAARVIGHHGALVAPEHLRET
jgi:2-dehydro-3-deoxygluconokinase